MPQSHQFLPVLESLKDPFCIYIVSSTYRYPHLSGPTNSLPVQRECAWVWWTLFVCGVFASKDVPDDVNYHYHAPLPALTIVFSYNFYAWQYFFFFFFGVWCFILYNMLVMCASVVHWLSPVCYLYLRYLHLNLTRLHFKICLTVILASPMEMGNQNFAIYLKAAYVMARKYYSLFIFMDAHKQSSEVRKSFWHFLLIDSTHTFQLPL